MKRVLASVLVASLSLPAAYAHAAEEPSVLVTTAPIRQQQLADVLTGYGTVVPDVGSTVNINLPRPGQVSRLLVSPGQIVRAGSALLEFDTSSTAALGYQQAVSALTFAREDLKRVEQMVAQQLATQAQLAAARKTVVDAQSALQAQRNVGAGLKTERVSAPFEGIVINLPVAQGDRIAAGATVLQFARLTGLRLQLGIEPSDSARVRPGMSVRLIPVLDGKRAVQATVDQVHGMVNPQTQLVDIVVRMRGRELIPGTRVRGDITVATVKAWTVPRSAVLRDAGGAYLFQVKEGRAHRIEVQTGTESGGVIGVKGSFDPALKVVTIGNYQLKDGMKVREATQ